MSTLFTTSRFSILTLQRQGYRSWYPDIRISIELNSATVSFLSTLLAQGLADSSFRFLLEESWLKAALFRHTSLNSTLTVRANSWARSRAAFHLLSD